MEWELWDSNNLFWLNDLNFLGICNSTLDSCQVPRMSSWTLLSKWSKYIWLYMKQTLQCNLFFSNEMSRTTAPTLVNRSGDISPRQCHPGVPLLWASRGGARLFVFETARSFDFTLGEQVSWVVPIFLTTDRAVTRDRHKVVNTRVEGEAVEWLTQTPVLWPQGPPGKKHSGSEVGSRLQKVGLWARHMQAVFTKAMNSLLKPILRRIKIREALLTESWERLFKQRPCLSCLVGCQQTTFACTNNQQQQWIDRTGKRSIFTIHYRSWAGYPVPYWIRWLRSPCAATQQSL